MISRSRFLSYVSVGLFLAAPLAHADVAPRAIEGTWRGRLGPEKGGLRLLRSITREPNGTRRALLDSIDQKSKIPVDAGTRHSARRSTLPGSGSSAPGPGSGSGWWCSPLPVSAYLPLVCGAMMPA